MHKAIFMSLHFCSNSDMMSNICVCQYAPSTSQRDLLQQPMKRWIRLVLMAACGSKLEVDSGETDNKTIAKGYNNVLTWPQVYSKPNSSQIWKKLATVLGMQIWVWVRHLTPQTVDNLKPTEIFCKAVGHTSRSLLEQECLSRLLLEAERFLAATDPH